MKKFLTLALSALLTMGLLTACGGKTTDKTVDLTAFYNTLAEEYGWAEDAASSGEEDIMMMNLEGDMLEGSYPCLLYTSPSPRDQRGSRMPSSA